MAPSPPRVATILWVLFGFDGRIGREVFWLGFLFMTAVATVAMTPYRLAGGLPETADPYFLALLLVALWSEAALAVKRLHDRGLTGFFAFLLALPLLNFVLFAILGLVPGEKRPNRYGPGPDRRGA